MPLLAQAESPADVERQGEAFGACMVFLFVPIVFAILWLKFRKSRGRVAEHCRST